MNCKKIFLYVNTRIGNNRYENHTEWILEIARNKNQKSYGMGSTNQTYEAAEKDGIPPSVLCVICGISGAAYRRKDGVYVVPITALRP